MSASGINASWPASWCFGDHVGHREVGAQAVTDAALDLGVAVGQVGVEAR
jgi:hypothetical protein